METLTAQQAKMVLEYFAAQAAEDMPTITSHGGDSDKHLWMTRYQASLAIERQITEADWDRLMERLLDLQNFDRDLQGWLHGEGFGTDESRIGDTDAHLKIQVSWAIDNAYYNSGA